MTTPDPIVKLIDKWTERLRAARRFVAALTVLAVTTATPIAIFTPLDPNLSFPSFACNIVEALPSSLCK